jgi:integrase
LTAETDGYEKAVLELKGQKILKRGDDPTLEQIEELYRAFCVQSPKSPRPVTIDHNIARLKCLMNRAGVSTIGKIDHKALFNKEWYAGDTPTPTERRTFASAIRAARSIFKKSAIRFYESRRLKIQNPFEGMELAAPRVSQFIPPSRDVIQKIIDTVEDELKPHDAMIVLLAFCGLRRSEIEAIVPSNFSKQSDRVILTIEEIGVFQPKAGQSGHIPIPHETYERLIQLRGKTDSDFFVPSGSKKKGAGRLWERVIVVNEWLKKNGLKNKPLHSLRKIVGSMIAAKDGIPAAASILRNTQAVCMINYAGSMTDSCVDIIGFLKEKDPFQELAEKLGMTVEELKKRLCA